MLPSLCFIVHVLTAAKQLTIAKIATSCYANCIAFRLVGKNMAIVWSKVVPCSLHAVLCLAEAAILRFRQLLPAAALFSP